MGDMRRADISATLALCLIAAFAPHEAIRLAAVFAAGWFASWAIEGDEP